MLKRKLDWTCSNCLQILNDPIMLPCGDLICRGHLLEKDGQENEQKCNECQQEFQVKDIQFNSNKTLKKLLESQSYLNDEECRLKQELEASTRKFFQLYGEIKQNKLKLQSVVSSHFEEIQVQIDQHVAKLRERIDAIAFKMKEEATIYEAVYSNGLKESFPSFDDSQSLEHELNRIEETFRNPNLLIQSIKDMQQKKEVSLNEIQLKFNQMNQVKDNLMATNNFKPSLFNQNEASLFGSIKLNGYTTNTNSFPSEKLIQNHQNKTSSVGPVKLKQNSSMNSFKSEILKDERQVEQLINVCELSANDKWSLLYRGTRDGFKPRVFHSKCDGHTNTLTVLKAKHSKYIFGGFTTVSWDKSSICKPDPNAFIFSLTNKDKMPLKMKAHPNEHQNAIRCEPANGPSFIGGIIIKNNANTTMDSRSNLGKTYPHPQYAQGTSEAKTFLAGSYNFQLDEIEVYEKK